ncbi:MAG: hypothetical protein ACW981_15390 [Candidatus Hodarchaeales archaeon]|jgi:hypothetical protein
MKLGNILENLVKRKITYYDLTYEQPHDIFFENLKDIPNLNELKISPVLLVTDLQPDSLISIAYTIRIAKSLGKDTKLYALTEGKHNNTIKEECEEFDIQLEKLIEKKNSNIEDILEIVDKYNIGLIIVSYGHHLWESIINQIPATVLVTSLRNIHK